MNVTRLGMALAACAMVAACASTPPPPPPPPPAPPPPPPPAPAASFDGTYIGNVVRVRTPSPHACVASHHVTVHVVNGSFIYRVGPKVVAHVTVEPGGAFTTTAGDTSIKGQLGDGQLNGTSDGKNCGYTIALAKH
jgi:hypothetical protein